MFCRYGWLTVTTLEDRVEQYVLCSQNPVAAPVCFCSYRTRLFCRYGRLTVATLEGRVKEYEKQVSQLERALARSDQHVEEMEEELSENRCRSASLRSSTRNSSAVQDPCVGLVSN